MVVSFYIGKIGILDTTINNALKIEGDLTVKQSFLDTGAKTIKTIKDREQKAIEDFEETKKIYFNNSEPETFYEFLTRIALRHGVEIVELNKLKENHTKINQNLNQMHKLNNKVKHSSKNKLSQLKLNQVTMF